MNKDIDKKVVQQAMIGFVITTGTESLDTVIQRSVELNFGYENDLNRFTAIFDFYQESEKRTIAIGVDLAKDDLTYYVCFFKGTTHRLIEFIILSKDANRTVALEDISNCFNLIIAKTNEILFDQAMETIVIHQETLGG